jgi:hypothetical protein
MSSEILAAAGMADMRFLACLRFRSAYTEIK